MKKLIEYLPALTICLVYFGFCNLYSYYIEFKIDIYNYISNTEILLSFLPTIVISITLIYGAVYQLVIQKSQVPNVKESVIIFDRPSSIPFIKKYKKVSTYFKSIPGLAIIYVIVKFLIILMLEKFFYFKKYELQNFELICGFILIFILYIGSDSHKNQVFINRNFNLVTIFIIIYMSVQINIYRKADADMLKAGVSIRKISFIYNNHKVKSSKSIMYIGQTQSSLFLYNIADSSTIIYKTSGIDSLILQ